MTEFEKVLMERDNMTSEEAGEERLRARRELLEMIDAGAGYDEVEDLLACDYGLEMDYLFDLI